MVRTAPWPHCPNRNVFSDCQIQLYDNSASLRCDSKLFHSPGPAAAKVLSPKVLSEWWYMPHCLWSIVVAQEHRRQDNNHVINMHRTCTFVKAEGPDIYIPLLTRKPKQQRLTMRSRILTGISYRRHSAISSHPLNERTVDPLSTARQTLLCHSLLHYGVQPAIFSGNDSLFFSSEY